LEGSPVAFGPPLLQEGGRQGFGALERKKQYSGHKARVPIFHWKKVNPPRGIGLEHCAKGRARTRRLNCYQTKGNTTTPDAPSPKEEGRRLDQIEGRGGDGENITGEV